MQLLRALAVVALVGALAACGGGGSSSGNGGPVATPGFILLAVPDPAGSNTWVSYTTSPPQPGPAHVLPTRGREVRIAFSAPIGSTFAVALRALSGAVTTIPENTGTVADPDAGYFQIVSVDPNQNPPLYTMLVRAPAALPDPDNYDVLVVHKSLRTDMTDSAAMVVPLRKAEFTVTITVVGAGHVTSNPPGITCGTAFSGSALTDCSHNFGPSLVPVTVVLNPNSNDQDTTRFMGWSGDCPSGVQSCPLSLDGTTPRTATATFVAR
jgi:hypothetical protein